MAEKTYYPALSNILSLNSIPSGLSFIRKQLEKLLSDLKYSNYIAETSLSGNCASYSLNIVLSKRAAVDIFGDSGLALVLNPDAKDATITSIPVTIEYVWELAKFFKLDIRQLGLNPLKYLQLFAAVTEVSEEDVLLALIFTIDDTEEEFDENIAFQNFADTYSNLYSQTPLTMYDEFERWQKVEYILEHFVEHNQSFYEVIFTMFFASIVSFDDCLTKIKQLFKTLARDVNFDNLQALITPKITASINNITLALEFPSTWLTPIDTAGKAIQGAKSQLRFNAGALVFSTETGVDFVKQQSLGFTRSRIGNTGLTLEFTNAKIDFRKDSNIPEATAAGYNDDFVGVFIESATIGLPASWGFDKTSTAEIKGKNLLIGTGGFTGTLGLEAKKAGEPNPLLSCNFGNVPVTLDTFELSFYKNSITKSSIGGSLTIQGFTDANNKPVTVGVGISFDTDGNFAISARKTGGIVLKFKDVFTLTINELTVGRSDNRFYFETSGSIELLTPFIKDYIKDPIEIQSLRIWDDGKIELQGGTIPLPKGFKIKIGPAEIFITSLFFGSTQKNDRKYNYWGFDGGVNVSPGGVNARGTGIKYCYSVDNKPFDHYLSIESISVDLIIPGKAKPENAAVLISGWLSLSDDKIAVGNNNTLEIETYAGGIDLALPKLRIAAGIDMKYAPKVPAFILDARLELPTCIPLGPTGMGIYGFRGLLGLRYITSKTAAELPETAEWYDYFKKDPLGIHVKKFKPPFDKDGNLTEGFSLGVGASIATSFDSGKTLSLKLFILLSMPNTLMLEGKAALLSQRVGLDTTTDPPFFAYLVLTDSEVETGFGLSFCIPEDSGDVLEVYASMQARFVFKNPKAWYIHVGTREKPNTGSLFNLLRVESFLMLSAAGIDMGAKAELSFSRSYLGGMLAADVYAYMECGGKISFERFQIAAFMATGGHVDVSVFKLGFYCGFDTTLSVEVPKPFTIEGSVSLAVGFRIFGKKIVCEFTVEFRWERSKNLIVPYISPLLGEAVELPVKAVSMLSQELFDISPLKENEGIQKINKLIPCDSYIDIEFVKPVNPKAVMDTVGGVGELDSTYEEIIPPKPIKKQATHSYSLENITIQYWDSDKWQPYHPYEAMSTPVQQGSDPIDFYSGELKLIGQWQMQSRGEYQRIRLLSQSVFSYMDKGLKGWVKPEEYGITAGSLFCANAELQNQRANWTAYALDTKVQSETLISKQDATQIVSCCITGERAHVGYVSNPYSLSKSLLFRNDSQCVIFLQESCAFVRLKLFTYSEYVTITYYKRNVTSITKIAEEIKTRYELLNPVDYENELQPVDILVIRPSFVDAALIQSKLREIEALCESVYESGEMKPAIRVLIQQLIEALEAMFQQSQAGSQLNRAAIEEQHYNLLQKYNRLLEELNAVRTQIARYEELLRVASQKMNSCCTVLHPTGEKTEKDVCIENLETIVPEGVSTQGIEGEYLRFIDNLRRLAQGLAQCKQNYTTNIDALCASSQEYITRLTKLLATSRETESTLVKQIEKTLEDGNRINTMLQGSPGDITVEPYGGYGDDCTVLHEIEWQSLREWQLNSNSPKQDAVAKSYKDSVQAIEHSLSPIWRPNTTFRVCITAKDEVKNRVGYETVDKKNAKEFKYYFGFKTGGPVGYFHKDYNATKTKEIDKYCPDGETNLLKYRLTTLRDYIDYERSYPNASGNLLQAKPLYYENTKLNLFYVHSYVYHLLNDWKKLGKLPAITGTLEVVVKDPLEDFEIPNPPPPDIETQYMPQSIVGWQPDTTPRVSKGVRITDILRNPELYNPDFIDIYGNRCWKAGAFPIKPASLKTVVTLNFLRPQTLYTALFYNVFGKERREVHRYVFQTSRYASMQEQFDSYVQTDAYGNVGRALYTIDVSLDGVKLQRLNTLLQTGKTGNSVIDSRFSNAFDSLIEGVLELGPQQPAETTEVSIVRNTHPTTGVVTILGLIVRSPEPMINPALPQEIKNLYCKPFQIDFPRNRTQSYAFAHSKDCSQFFVTHATENQLTSSELRLTFTSYAWDGKAYSPERDDTNTIISCSLNVSLIN